MWHEWNANAGDVMMTWSTLYANLVTSHLACTMCAHMHGAHALNKYAMSKNLSGLACMKLTQSKRK